MQTLSLILYLLPAPCSHPLILSHRQHFEHWFFFSLLYSSFDSPYLDLWHGRLASDMINRYRSLSDCCFGPTVVLWWARCVFVWVGWWEMDPVVVRVPDLNMRFRDEGVGQSSTWCQLLLHFPSMLSLTLSAASSSTTVKVRANKPSGASFTQIWKLFTLTSWSCFEVVVNDALPDSENTSFRFSPWVGGISWRTAKTASSHVHDRVATYSYAREVTDRDFYGHFEAWEEQL